MTDKEVLIKAMKIANKNGCNISKGYIKRIQYCKGTWDAYFVSRVVCFTHSFAKAFFGNENSDIPTIKKLDIGHYMFDDQENWSAHLQQMVLESNPIDYLRKFIKDER